MPEMPLLSARRIDQMLLQEEAMGIQYNYFVKSINGNDIAVDDTLFFCDTSLISFIRDHSKFKQLT